MADAKQSPAPQGATGVLVLASGTILWGRGFGAEGDAVGEVVFNTAMTGYQEVMTDPSYAAQIITFTFPHIGNVGANYEDLEADNPFALGCIVRQDVTNPSNYRAVQGFDQWMKANGRIGLSGIDTRALTRRIREEGAPNGVIAHNAKGRFDVDALLRKAREWPGLEGMDLAKEVSCRQMFRWSGGRWKHGTGYDEVPLPPAGGVRGGPVEAGSDDDSPTPSPSRKREGRPHVVAIDYGSKRNIFRNLADAGADVTVLPATSTFEDVMAHRPDGIFLSNGPGDPAATGEYAVPVIRQLLETGKPLFGICLGHQLLGLAVGAKTVKMHQGHRGANHPVKRLSDGRVEITSMNHGFAVETETLPENARATHVSLFDGSLAGLELTDRPAFSVQYHPEASPGPQDSTYLFKRFVQLIGAQAAAKEISPALDKLIGEALQECPEVLSAGMVIFISGYSKEASSLVHQLGRKGVDARLLDEHGGVSLTLRTRTPLPEWFDWVRQNIEPVVRQHGLSNVQIVAQGLVN